MSIIIIIIIIVIAVSSMINSSKENKQTEIRQKINKGELIRLSNGEVKQPSQITHYDKIYLPDYQYIIANHTYDIYYSSEPRMYYDLDNYKFMSLDELKKTADRIRNNKNKIDQERRRVEQIKRDEQQRREAEERRIREEEERIRYEQKIAQERLDYWNELSSKIIFEIHTSHQDSRKSGIYVIHCIKNNKLYVGSASNLLSRKSLHISNLKKEKHHSFKLQEDYNNFGDSSFQFYVLAIIEDEDIETGFIRTDDPEKQKKKDKSKTMKNLEQSFIDEYNPDYNIHRDVYEWQKKRQYERYGR